jgi:predicted AlkP superfamily phosphohydrolase/phosphomutase
MIVIISIDGMAFDLIRKYKDSGKLPNIKGLEEKGVYGTFPHKLLANETMAWTVFSTGQNMGESGIWDEYFRKDKTKHIPDIKVDSDSIEIETLSSYLPKNGQVAVFINNPLLDPAPVVHGGFCVSENEEKNNIIKDTWPEDYKDVLNKKLAMKGEKIGIDDELEKKITDDINFEIVNHFIRDYWIKDRTPDLILAHLDGIAKIHEHYYEESQKNEAVKPDSELDKTMEKYYGYIDKKIGEILRVLDKEDSLMIFSSSSMMQPKGFINLNSWLIENGYLSLKDKAEENNDITEGSVDWEKTRAWSIGNCGQIYINLEGKEKNGIVKQEEYIELTSEIIDKLKDALKQEDEKITIEARLGEDTSFGDKENLGPDIFVSFNNGEYKVSTKIKKQKLTSKYSDGEINKSIFLNQIGNYFLLFDPDLEYRGEIEKIKFPSFTSAILDILKIKIPDEMEQSILKVIDVMYLKKDRRAVASSGGATTAIGLDSKVTAKDSEDGSEQEQQVMSRLESLGY